MRFFMISAGTKRQRILLKFAFACLFSIHTRAHILLFLLQSVKNIFFHKKKIGIHTAPNWSSCQWDLLSVWPSCISCYKIHARFLLAQADESRTENKRFTPDWFLNNFTKTYSCNTTQHGYIHTRDFMLETRPIHTEMNQPYTYNTRCPSSSINPSFKGNIYVNSCFPRTIKDWNPLAINIRKIETVLNALFG